MGTEPQTMTVEDAFCVYLGPTIVGVIQYGTIYMGSKEQALKTAAAAIEKYPLIARLIVTSKTLAQDRIKIKTPGNLLYETRRHLTRKF